MIIIGFEIVKKNENFNVSSLKKIHRGLGVLQSGIRVRNNSWPALAHERVE